MIQITNVSPDRWSLSTSYVGGKGTPLYFNLAPVSKIPNNVVLILKENLKNYGSGIKQAIADAVGAGVIVVEEMNGVHVAFDRTAYTVPPYIVSDLNSLYAAANLFKAVYNVHQLSTAFHTAAGALPIVAVDATNLATLIALLTEARADYNAHIAVAIHPNVDTKNGIPVAVPVPIDAPTCYTLLKYLWGLYPQHCRWCYNAASAPLNPVQIITY